MDCMKLSNNDRHWLKVINNDLDLYCKICLCTHLYLTSFTNFCTKCSISSINSFHVKALKANLILP